MPSHLNDAALMEDMFAIKRLAFRALRIERFEANRADIRHGTPRTAERLSQNGYAPFPLLPLFQINCISKHFSKKHEICR